MKKSPNKKNYLKTFNGKIEDNVEVFDFYSKVLSSFLTLLALGATIYFSLMALEKTDTQNRNAEKQLIEANAQLKLAQQQFQYSKQLHTEDSISSVIKEKIANERFVKDTTKQGLREREQEVRNHFQEVANKQQFIVNKNQLAAIQIQARIAEAQYSQQQDQYKQLLYEQRPVFYIDSVGIATVNSVKSTIRFFFSNKGIRTAHVDSTVLAFYNPKFLCLSVTSNSANLDLIPLRNFLATTTINIYEDCLKSNLTVYYLLIYYKDKITGASQVEPIFFTYGYLEHHQFVWTRVIGTLKSDFIEKLKKKHVFVID